MFSLCAVTFVVLVLPKHYILQFEIELYEQSQINYDYSIGAVKSTHLMLNFS